MVYNEYFEEIRRLYDPTEDPCARSIPLNEFVVYNAEKHISQLQIQVMAKPAPFPNLSSLRGLHMGSLLDPDSPHNTYGILPNSLPQTSTRAEIEALCQALKIVCDVTDHDLKLSEIKIATDSRFLVDAMSQWIEQWIEDNGMGSSGRQVAHFDVLKQIYEQLDYMEYSDDGRAREVQFWYVPREMNEADVLANKALDEAEKQASEK